MKRSSIITVIKLGIAFGLVWFVISQVGWENLKTSLSQMDLSDAVLGFGVMFVAYCISMVRWRMLMRSVGIEASFWDTFRLGFIGAFFNNVVPGLTGGDLIKAVYVARDNPDARADAVLTVIVDRIVGIVALAMIAAVVIPFDLATYKEAAIGTYGFLAVAGIGGAVMLSRRIKARLKPALAGSRAVLGRVMARFGRKPDPWREGVLTKLDRAVSTYRHRLDVLSKALALSLAVHLLIIVSIWLLAGAIAKGNIASLGENPDPARLAELQAFGDLGVIVHCSIVPIIMIGSALPIAPAGWGVGEALFVYFYVPAGASQALAVALSLAYRLTATLLSLLGAPFLLADRKRILSAAKEGAESAAGSPE